MIGFRKLAPRFFAIGLALATVGFFTSVGPVAANAAAHKKKPVKKVKPFQYHVGLNIDLSGTLAFQGGPFKEGFQAYINAVNKKGGVNGHKIDVSTLDDQSTVSTAIANVTQLKQADHVSAVVGMLSSSEGVGLETTSNSLKLPLFDTLVSQASNGAYQWGIDTPISVEPVAQIAFAAALMKQEGITSPKVAFLTVITPVIANWLTLAEQLVAAKGWTVVSNQQSALTATSLTTQDQAIANAKPDVVIEAEASGAAILSVRDFQSFGLNVPVLEHTSGGIASNFNTLADPNYYALVSEQQVGIDRNPAITAEAAAAAAAGVPINSFFSNGYQNAYEIAHFFAKCPGTCTSVQMQATISKYGTMTTGGLSEGPLKWSPAYHGGVQYVRMYHWTTGGNIVPTGSKYNVNQAG
jgi:ABC-type branched-subunit amino acid transport system substrate-binding protein